MSLPRNGFHSPRRLGRTVRPPPALGTSGALHRPPSSAVRTGVALIVAMLTGVACTAHPTPTGGAPSPLEGTVLRPSQAPIVGLTDVLDNDTLVGKRVRVLGWCAGAPNLLVGRRVGAWFLASPDTLVEVRGLVPKECSPSEAQQTLVLLFAQVVRAKADSGERLLLRLPD